MDRLPPLTELRAFEAAARLRSFQRAAAELGVTPTAISHQIRLLEQNLGTTLFRRRPRPMMLTDAGQRLLPGITHGLAMFAEAVEHVRRNAVSGPLVVTTTNAFATRWLIPRLPAWRAQHPDLPLEVIGTDDIVDLHAGDAHVAIRYARQPPAGFASFKLFEDRHWPAAAPGVLPTRRVPSLGRFLAGQTLIHTQWRPDDAEAPTWQRWLSAEQARSHEIPAWNSMKHLRFREEAHAIEAALAGQGVAICSDILVAREFRSGSLVRLSDLSLPGYGFFMAHPKDRGQNAKVIAFRRWVLDVALRSDPD